jgi:hypothetical protein
LVAVVRGLQLGHPQEHLEIILYLVLLLLQVAAVLEVLETLMLCLAVQVAARKGSKQNLEQQVFLGKEITGVPQMVLRGLLAAVAPEL